MCIIIDANTAKVALKGPVTPAAIAVLDWIENKGGMVAYGGENLRELAKIGVAMRVLNAWTSAGLARRIDENAIAHEQAKIAALCKSNDSHVIALARASGARVVWSEDQALHADFKNPNLLSPKGRVYQDAGHKDILRHWPPCHLSAKRSNPAKPRR